MIEGHSVETKRQLIRVLFEHVPKRVGISTTDLEICIQESLVHNWGFRGQLGDEIQLNYRVDVGLASWAWRLFGERHPPSRRSQPRRSVGAAHRPLRRLAAEVRRWLQPAGSTRR